MAIVLTALYSLLITLHYTRTHRMINDKNSCLRIFKNSTLGEVLDFLLAPVDADIFILPERKIYVMHQREELRRL